MEDFLLPSELMEEFNSSIQFDKLLYVEDIDGSIAHSEMLSKQKIISKNEFLSIKSGLEQIRKEISITNLISQLN